MPTGKAAAMASPQQTSTAPKPKRLNKAIELLEMGEPVYFITARGGYDEGKKAAQTWADAICYDMEHSPLNLTGLDAFMKGLVDGGPTKSGHRTPAVIPQLPVGGWDEATMQANYWMFHQVLDTGAHGIYLCHAGSPDAIRVMMRSCRFPFNRIGVVPELPEGRRGSGGQRGAAQSWGIPVRDYLNKADIWPVNPDGELLMAIKCEDKYALANCEKCCAVPGVGFVEWGPGDMSMSLGMPMVPEFGPIEMRRARARVLAAAKANHVPFLNSGNVDNIIDQIKEGVMVFLCPQAAAEKGRAYTKRTMPW
jgi:4-hydroxy-2-oxoheptanedioate aldolase